MGIIKIRNRYNDKEWILIIYNKAKIIKLKNVLEIKILYKSSGYHCVSSYILFYYLFFKLLI